MATKNKRYRIGFYCFKLTWEKNGKRRVSNLAGAGTQKDIIQTAKECGVKIIELLRITDKVEIAKLERKYLASH